MYQGQVAADLLAGDTSVDRSDSRLGEAPKIQVEAR